MGDRHCGGRLREKEERLELRGSLWGGLYLGRRSNAGMMVICRGRGEMLVQESECQGEWHPFGKGIDERSHAPG